MLSIAKIRAALAKPFLPAFFFFAGVTFDTITLTRIDRLLDNLIILLYLTLLGGLIVLTGRMGLKEASAKVAGSEGMGSPVLSNLVVRTRSYYPMAIQFLLGGLFSAYTIFYSKSASLTTTAVFFAVLVAFLVANEFLRSRLSQLPLLVSLYALVCFSFFTFFFPVVTGVMNTGIFLLGSILSIVVVVALVRGIYKGLATSPSWAPALTTLPAVAVVVVLVGFYFLNWIPPVPLSLKFGGVYHKVEKIEGRYHLTFEQDWYQFWKRSDNPLPAESRAYCFTAVFAPVRLNTTIYHHWQYRPFGARAAREYSTTDRVGIAISGGRETGYRSYTVKQRLAPGDWRVNVETEKGRVIGRVAFQVLEQTEAPSELKTIIH
jgi:hypothetical protein